MSPLGSKTRNPDSSDSEDDDYVPDTKASESSSSEDEKIQEGSVAQGSPPGNEEKKKARDALWSSFQASVANPGANSSSRSGVPEPKLVKIERRYRFAGEDTVEVIEVPEDSPEAKRWPIWKDPNTNDSLSDTTATIEEAGPAAGASSPSSKPGAPSLSPTLISASSSSTQLPNPNSTEPAKPPARRPGPRKSKTVLAPLPGPVRAKKLTTLDKSAMDWQAHVRSEQASGSGIQDELEANRRGGGYLEKVEFLKRVEERKEETLDSLKSNKRRRL